MPVSVTMPRLGESVSEGTVTRWLKKEGERVEVDEPLLEVSTDKVDTEIPAPAAGVVVAIRVGEDVTVDVGAELAVIDEAGAGAPAGRPEQAEPEQAEPEQAEPEQAEPEQAGPEQAGQAGTGEPAAGAVAEETGEAGQDDLAAESKGRPAEEPDEPPIAEAGTGTPTASAPVQGDGHAPAYVTPLVRKLAAERGIDLGRISGTGVGGRIRKQDVLDAARSGGTSGPAAGPAVAGSPAAGPAVAGSPAAGPAVAGSPAAGPAVAATTSQVAAPTGAPATDVRPAPTGGIRPTPSEQAAPAAGPSPAPGRTERMSRLRRLIAGRMVESLQVSAQLTTVVEADITEIAQLRSRAQDAFSGREGVRLSFLPFFAVSTVEALKAHPVLNASIDPDAGTITYHEEVRLGIAVDTPRGLLVPVIHNAGDLNLPGMARRIIDLAERTRGNAVTPDELGGGTFTLTNTGSRGALFDTPIINQPQVGILGTGAVVKRPAVIDTHEYGEIVAVRSMLYLALTYDHRIVDGADAARFLADVKNRLEEAAFAHDLGL